MKNMPEPNEILEPNENNGKKRNKNTQGEECYAWGCSKRYRPDHLDLVRSDSSGSSDEESAAKRKAKRSFHA